MQLLWEVKVQNMMRWKAYRMCPNGEQWRLRKIWERTPKISPELRRAQVVGFLSQPALRSFCFVLLVNVGSASLLVDLLLPRPRYIGGCGIVFDRFLCIFVYLFIYIFVSLLARLRENGWTDLHETFREGVEWPWDDLIPRNRAMPRCATRGRGLLCFRTTACLQLFIVSRTTLKLWASDTYIRICLVWP